MKKVFADYHHGGLYHALHILFVERLGWELYRPVGMEWAEKGIWKYSDNPPTQRQYLDPDKHELRKDGYYYWRDNSEEIDHKCLTFKQFEKMDIDIVLATVFQHEATFKHLQVTKKPKAKFVRLIGNSGAPVNWNITRNLIDTTNLYPAPDGVKRVVWHQEFPDDLFYYTEPKSQKIVKQYLNCFDETPFYEIWKTYENLMDNYQWFMHGLNGDDGFISPVSKLAQSMRETSWIWHIKQHGEGYGHIVHNAFCVGRPLITIRDYYKGKIAYPMMKDEETCLDLEGYSIEENINRIRWFSDPKRHKAMCEACRKEYEENVDFDQDFKRVKEFLGRLN